VVQYRLILSRFYFDGILGAGLLANFNFTGFWKRIKFLFIRFKITEQKPELDILIMVNNLFDQCYCVLHLLHFGRKKNLRHIRVRTKPFFSEKKAEATLMRD